MKEKDIPIEFTQPTPAAELTAMPESSYAKSGMNPPNNMDPNRPINQIETPHGERFSSLEEEILSAIAYQEVLDGPMTDEQKEGFKRGYLATIASGPQDPRTPADQENNNQENANPVQGEQVDPASPNAPTAPRNETADEDSIKEYLKQPENLEDVVVAMAKSFSDFHSKHAFFTRNEMGEIISISDANILRWLRTQIIYYEGEEGPDTSFDYNSKIIIPLRNGNLAIGSIIQNDERYLKEKNGFKHAELGQQMRRELFARKIIRDRDIRYRRDGKGMGDDSGISGTYFGILKESSMTRSELWNGKSLTYWTMEAPFDFVEEATVSEEEKKNDPLWRTKRQDTRLGRATATALMAYYHISDVEKLKEMLQDKDGNTPFFQRNFWEQGRQELAKQDLPANPQYVNSIGELEKQFITNEQLDKIFGQNGRVKNTAEFVKFINFFAEAQVNSNQRRLVRYVLQQSIGHKYRLTRRDEETNTDVMDEEMLFYAESQAFLMTRWTGIAARNDWGAAAYDAQSKILHTKEYRLKQASPDRGGAFGNMYNVGMFKALGVNYLDAITTVKEGKDKKRMLLREVLEDIVRVPMISKEQEDNSNPQDMQSPLMKERVEALEALSGLTFNADTEQNLATNGANRWYEEFHSFVGGKELHLQKTVEWARLRGVVYDPAQFGELIQEGFLKPLRYGYSTWQLQFDKQVRDLVECENPPEGTPYIMVSGKKKMFVNTSMAESMFGNQVLDVKEFWAGEKKVDADGKPYYDEKTLSKHVLAPERVVDNRAQLFKQMALSRIAADIRSHRDFFNSPYPQWDAATVEALIKALERVPGGLLVDENDVSNTMIPKYFFDKADIKYLRSLAHVTYGQIAKTDGTIALGKSVGKTGWAFAKAMWKGLTK